ncbi:MULTISPECIES: hypothetical protein [Nostoc]|uniref:Uncharacterized protein n=1 Tax=Nostoc paludosum FACHB-159 TaxID=2692908 RepID=A0ABR8KFA1_9NOSO|nr:MULTISPECIES: hypothetical protein [Nostoc]MBD2738246.1 hypothetical protein [Nostoc paludosum FACHB-159]
MGRGQRAGDIPSASCLLPSAFSSETPPLKPIPNWAKTQDVILYQGNYRRRQLEDKENQAIAQAAVALVKKYGVATKDNQLTYQADAFTINKKGEDYTIYRRHDSKPLMTFMADRWSQVRRVNLAQDFNTENHPINILPVERQEFLLIADYLKSGKQLPSVDDDSRKIACVLSSVSPSGTHNILESFKQPQVLQIMMGAIRNFEKDDLILGNYRILFQQGADGKSTLQLFKTELGGLQREAVRFEFERTETGMTHQVKALAITEADLEKLGLLAQKLHINYQSYEGDPNDTRDIDLPVHPEITRNLDKEQSHQSTQSTPNVPDRKTQSNPQQACFNSPMRQKLTTTGKLTIGEQRELYQKILLQSLVEQHDKGQTNISLPPLSDVVQDLMNARSQIINNTYTPSVEVHSQHQKSHTPQQLATNSQELE